ncbi:hypothetical protein BDDG_12594 [Blastomyces dermatitidis ATCC 18188]|uniref:Uncharacterized protein n=1 Tax=Ajellomyces dermatitidis (strain ATCC 18188 / CBS 674.68) TaxID=653446 RepID=A0A0J9ESJ1_AJEDA|nr:hypothetical protein BDDG_12594 [Blastomyces dermatitidis ATCC 18188]
MGGPPITISTCSSTSCTITSTSTNTSTSTRTGTGYGNSSKVNNYNKNKIKISSKNPIAAEVIETEKKNRESDQKGIQENGHMHLPKKINWEERRVGTLGEQARSREIKPCMAVEQPVPGGTVFDKKLYPRPPRLSIF